MNRSIATTRFRRSGMTLIEVMAAMSIFFLFALMAVGILRFVTDVGQRTNRSTQVRRSTMRLAEQIRLDAETTNKITVNENTFPLVMTSNAAHIEYKLDPTTATLQRSKLVAGELVAAESFTLPSTGKYEVTVNGSMLSIALMDDTRPARWIIETKTSSSD